MSIQTVSIVGTGAVGLRIALACASDGLPVTLVRATRGEAQDLRGRLARRLEKTVGDGARSEQVELVLSRIEIASDLGAVAEADLVIDATVALPRARRAVLATIEPHLSSAAVLATSSDPDRLVELAEVLRRPDQLVGLRFTDGGGVELSYLPETAPGVVAACRWFVTRFGSAPEERQSQPPRIGYREWTMAAGAMARAAPSDGSAPGPVRARGAPSPGSADAVLGKNGVNLPR